MPQFTVHRNANPGSKTAYPLLLDIQSDLMVDLGTRVVVPLCRTSTMKGKPITNLTPVFDIEGERYTMLTPQLAGVSRKQIGAAVANLRERRTEIIAALDLLITGV
jgi:toxin CcdB